MSLTASTLKKLTREELANIVMEYQSKFEGMLASINSDMANINSDMASLKDRFTKMEAELMVTRTVNDKLVKQNRLLERKCAANEQYSRRECLEICGIPDNISNNDLEDTVLNIFNETGVRINSRDVEACHRLNSKNKPKKVIIKLSKRKDVARVMKNKTKLKNINSDTFGLPSGCKIYINESLCKYYKYLWMKCKRLQIRNCIQSFWVTNGSIRIKHQNDEVTSVTHIADLEKYFTEEDLRDNDEDDEAAD